MKALFVSHAASRTGAPKILLYIMHYLQEVTDIEIDILIRQDGDMLDEFEAIGPTFLWGEQEDNSLLDRAIAKAKGKGRHPRAFINHFDEQDYDLIYVNSAVCADILVELGNRSMAKTVLHVHELEFNLRNMLAPTLLKAAFERSDKVIAVSELVRNNLMENHGLRGEDVALVYEFIPRIDEAVGEADVRKEYGIGDDELLVGGSGLTNWRKGTDMFLQVANTLKRRNIQGVRMMWIGGNHANMNYKHLAFDHEKFGLAEQCIMVPHVKNSYDYQRALDVFLMLSREDPFPLVAIENGQLGHPIFCFKGCTGTEEFVDDSCGGVVDYMDIDSLVDKIIELKNNPELLKANGQEAKRRFSQFSIEKAGKEIHDLIKEVLGK